MVFDTFFNFVMKKAVKHWYTTSKFCQFGIIGRFYEANFEVNIRAGGSSLHN